MTTSFTDSGQTLEDFVETIYVHCPRCQKCAQVKRIPSNEDAIPTNNSDHHGSLSYQQSFSPRKLSCLHCSYTRIRTERSQLRGGPYDWYFQLPLWLQTPCCGEILWTLNEDHLSFLERYVTARQRNKFYVPGQIRNGTMASRLPDWMKSAKNRDQILKGFAQLKALLAVS